MNKPAENVLFISNNYYISGAKTLFSDNLIEYPHSQMRYNIPEVTWTSYKTIFGITLRTETDDYFGESYWKVPSP
jgi:hypothetical protein